MITIACRLIDTGDIERYFDRVALAQIWVKGIGENYFEYVEMLVPNEHDYDTIEGYQEILAYGRESDQEVD